MKIIGIGIDIVKVSRIKKIFDKFKYRFIHKILTINEKNNYNNNYKNNIYFLAKHFAIKESAVKALNTGFTDGIFFNQFELYSNKNGKPKLKIFHQALNIANKMKYKKIHVSFSDEKKYVCAIVIIEG
ncbi:holo-ACP synthase [Enterobacteriaceae endosymbiont of Plateumaris consimilis]|uniref:holo-ACP synthase n=1 Tax=Enterobacteriaceae endosymbiont of Plateumaris consimilis TaxID=2675794 RepID=UPI001449EDBF|nr:holo-ACP synthase [Enterobacteriaceae endosymbiont of Plateumaris consimilis]QJC28580.1 holo-ACP synthase [Enterobacteriaceae endosymbiont of Plateumaris consimilis]